MLSGHQRIDARSLAFGKAIAAKLEKQPELIELARENLRRWMTTVSPRTLPVLQEWITALDGPIDGVIALLTGEDERAIRLRQSNPFAGALSEEERNAILKQFAIS